jgi:hypothetical protein
MPRLASSRNAPGHPALVPDENRDDRLETLVLRTSRLMIWLVAICGGGVMAAIAIAIVVVLKS